MRPAHLTAWRVAEASHAARRSADGAAAIDRALRYLVPLVHNVREALARWPAMLDAQIVEAIGACRGLTQIDEYYTPEARRMRRLADRCHYWPATMEPTPRGMAAWFERRCLGLDLIESGWMPA